MMRQIIKRILTWLMGMIRQNARPKNVTAARENFTALEKNFTASRENVTASEKISAPSRRITYHFRLTAGQALCVMEFI